MKASSFLNNHDFYNHRGRSTVVPAPEESDSNPRHFQKCKGRKLQMVSILESTQIEPDSISLRQLAREKVQQGNYTQAIEILNYLIDRHPTDANDYNNRGLIYFQSGQLASAIADYNKAIQLNPFLAGAYNNRANFYAEQGQLEEALADYDKAIDLNPLHVRAWINQGITYRDLELYDQAIDNFDFALRLGQLKGYIWSQRGRTYHLMGDWNYAIADYRRALDELSDGRRHQQVKNWLNDLLSPIVG